MKKNKFKKTKQFKKIGKDLRPVIIIVLAAVTFISGLISYIEFRVSSEGLLSVYFFDIGQGDAALAVWDDGAILFDAGTNESEEKLVSYIKRLGVRTIDCAVFSHPHEDHIGGADKIFESFVVESVIKPDIYADSRCYDAMEEGIKNEKCAVYEAAYGMEYNFGDVTLSVLAPEGEYGNLNLDCAVIMLEYGDVSFLFTGDCEGEAEDDLTERLGSELEANVLKVGHHGSANATGEVFLNMVMPDIAVISCGRNNDYGHPHEEVLSRLESHGIDVRRTDLENTVTVVSDGNKVWVKEKKH